MAQMTSSGVNRGTGKRLAGVRRRLADARRCGIGEEAVEKHCARSEYVCHPKNQLISADIGGVELSTGQPGKQIYLYRFATHQAYS